MQTAIDWANVSYEVRYGDLSICIEQWESHERLLNIITLHTSETRNGTEFPFKYRVTTEHYNCSKAPF